MALATDVASLVEPLQRIALHLSHAQGSAVLLATTPDADLARELAEELTRRLTASHVVRSFHFAPDRLNLPAFLRTLPLPDSERRSVVFGFGLDDLAEADRERAMDELNLGRETLRWTGHSVVLWLRAPTVQQITFQAPDFFAVRSGLFDFTAPTDGVAREETLRALNVNGAATLPDLRQRYLDYVISTYRWLDFRGLMQMRNLVRLPLKDVFVPLAAQKEIRNKGLQELGEFHAEFEVLDESHNYKIPSPLLDRALRTVLENSQATLGAHWRPELFEFKFYEKRDIEIVEALRENSHLVVLGDPGSGKSTLLKYLALTFAEGEVAVRERLKLVETRLPILAPVSAYALALRAEGGDREGRALLGFLPRHFESLGLPNLGPLFQQALDAGEAILLLDGLDEVLDTETRAHMARQVEALAAAYPRCRFVVTSRIAGYASAALGVGFATVTIRPFERTEIEKFAQQWSRAYESLNVGQDAILSNTLLPGAELRAEARAKSLTEAIFANPAIERLATTPLLLTLLALIHHQGTRLPSRRVELYRLCVEALAETWNLARSQSGQPIELWLGERRLDEREVVRLLAPVAFHMHERQPGGLISRAELETLIAEQLRDDHGDHAPALAHQFVELVREQVGLMLERGPDLFGFMHLTFEEYLAARFLVDRLPEDRVMRLRPHLHDPRWREVILLTAASLSGDNATDFVRALRDSNSPLNNALHLDLLLAARCLVDDVPVETLLRRELVDAIVELALQIGLKELSEEATTIISSLYSTASASDVVSAFVAALQDKNEVVRARAAEALGKSGMTSEPLVNTLVAALDDKSAYVREKVALALGRIGLTLDAMVTALMPELRESYSFRANAALLQLARTSDVLAEKVVNTLIQELRSRRVVVRRNVVEVLGHLGQVSKWLADKVVDALVPASRDKDWRVRVRAAEALGKLGSTSDIFTDKLVNTLVKALQHDEDESVRAHAAEALGHSGVVSEAVVNALISALQDASWKVRRSAESTLWKLVPKMYEEGVSMVSTDDKRIDG